MTQNASDVEIANQGFAAFRQDLNDVLEDITTLHSGTAAPSTTYANQWWYETDTDKLYIRNEDNDAWIEILTLDQANDHLATLGASITLDGTGNVSIDSGDFTVDTNTLHVDSTNNRVGVGTASPAQLLSVEQSTTGTVDALVKNTGTGASANARVMAFVSGASGGDPQLGVGVTGVQDYFWRIDNDDSDKLKLDSNGTTRMTIESSGNVGIGTSSPSRQLHVSGSGANTRLRVENTTGSSILDVYAEDGGNSTLNYSSVLTMSESGTERMRIDSSGYVHIGTGGSQAGTTVAGTSLRGLDILKSTNTTSNANQVVFYNPNGVVGLIRTSGSSTAYITSSDYRLKENVTGITDGIERVKQLNPLRFNFIADADATVDGFLAHEAATVVPEAVSGERDAVDEDGNPDYQGIDQAKLVPLLTAALQEAIAKIEDLETRVAALEN